MSEQIAKIKRDYSMFDADLSGAVLNVSLLGRLFGWLRPYRAQLVLSSILVLVASFLNILLPITISLVAIDYIIRSEPTTNAPDFGLIELNDALSQSLSIHPLLAACLMYAVCHSLWAAIAHAHRMTLIGAVVKGLRDLRNDLFAHLETRPSSFYDRVAVGRIMTRVTNDVEALYELLRGLGTLIGEFVPFLVALTVMFAINTELTITLLIALPLLTIVTFYFRSITRKLFRQVRQTVSALNQSLQENLAGLEVVQLSDRQRLNYERYTKTNTENRNHETKLARVETLYGAFNDSLAHAAIGVIIWFSANLVVDTSMSLGEVILFTQFIAAI